MKSTVDEIRARFDTDVERFSNLETGQAATMDAPLMMGLTTRIAAAATPDARDLLDLGCGAGNYSLKLLEHLSAGTRRPGPNVTLVDLSRPMLDRATERVSAATTGRVRTLQGDVREVDLGEGAYDIVVAAAVLHHLRPDAEWAAVFGKVFRALRSGGGFWIVDLVDHDHPAVRGVMWAQYGDYLTELRDAAYRDTVFAYIEREDTPRSLGFQKELLVHTGFTHVEVLHKRGPFAAFGGVRLR